MMGTIQIPESHIYFLLQTGCFFPGSDYSNAQYLSIFGFCDFTQCSVTPTKIQNFKGLLMIIQTAI